VPLRPSVTDRVLDLPPPYDAIPLREVGDAFAHACAVAGEKGAGTLVWVRRYDLAEFAVVLEPEEALTTARRAVYVGMNALADTLSVYAPPERPVTFDWPDAIRIDGVLVGGGRLGWPRGARETETPPWIVFSGMVRTFVMRADEPGFRPLLGALEELGFTEIDPGEIIGSFARHLMAGFHDWSAVGFATAERNWLERLPRSAGERAGIAENGDLLLFRGKSGRPAERRSLTRALARPSWLDPETGTPWL
jgi:hypothetical protein